jgi:hypothetical protein
MEELNDMDLHLSVSDDLSECEEMNREMAESVLNLLTDNFFHCAANRRLVERK